MHKTNLVDQIANDTGLSKKDSAAALESALTSIAGALKSGDSVTLIGFGTFSIVNAPAREGRNPQTGEKIKISARNRVKFSAGKALKDQVN